MRCRLILIMTPPLRIFMLAAYSVRRPRNVTDNTRFRFLNPGRTERALDLAAPNCDSHHIRACDLRLEMILVALPMRMVLLDGKGGCGGGRRTISDPAACFIAGTTRFTKRVNL